MNHKNVVSVQACNPRCMSILPCFRSAVLWVSLLPGAARTPLGSAKRIPPLSWNNLPPCLSTDVLKSYISSFTGRPVSALQFPESMMESFPGSQFSQIISLVC